MIHSSPILIAHAPLRLPLKSTSLSASLSRVRSRDVRPARRDSLVDTRAARGTRSRSREVQRAACRAVREFSRHARGQRNRRESCQMSGLQILNRESTSDFASEPQQARSHQQTRARKLQLKPTRTLERNLAERRVSSASVQSQYLIVPSHEHVATRL